MTIICRIIAFNTTVGVDNYKHVYKFKSGLICGCL